MKIGIVTITDGENYGNRLQNYALQTALIEIGCDIVETIQNPPNKKSDNSLLVNRFRIITKAIGKMIIHPHKAKDEYEKLLRWYKFRNFTKTYIKQSKYILYKWEKNKELAESYDYFVVGSDQVWNPEFSIFSDVDFLAFAPEYKRIAYAASIGVERIPEDKIEWYANNLLSMRAISVREDSAKELIHKLTGLDVPVVLDPTLLLTAEQWLALIKAPKRRPQEKYALAYLLNGGSVEERSKFEKIANEHNLKPIYLMDSNKNGYCSLDPFEFLWMIYNADLVYTNSFHGTVFSLMFKKKIFCMVSKGFNDKMSSRFDTLFRFCNIKINSNYIEPICDFDDRINPYRTEALSYLKQNTVNYNESRKD